MNAPTRVLELTVPTVTASTHIAGDALGGRLDFTGALRECGNGGVLESITLIHMSTNVFEADLFLFDDVFVATADDSPFSPTDPDIQSKCLGSIRIYTTNFATTANHAVATVSAIGLSVELDNAPGTLYAQLVTRTAFTPAGLYIKLGFLKD